MGVGGDCIMRREGWRRLGGGARWVRGRGAGMVLREF